MRRVGLVGALILGLPIGLVISLICHAVLILWGVGLFDAAKPLAAVQTDSVLVDLVPAEEAEPKPADATQPPSPRRQPEAEPAPQTGPQAEFELDSPPAIDTPHPSPSPPTKPAIPPPVASAPPATASPAPPIEPSVEPQQQTALPLQLADAMALPPDLAAAARPADIGAKLEPGLVTAFKAHVNKWFVVPRHTAASRRVKLVIRLSFNPDGTFARNPEVIEVSSPTAGVPVMESALRALSQCGPYDFLPPDNYEEWRLLDLTFAPDGVR